MKKVDGTIKVIKSIAKESDKFNSQLFSEEEGLVFGVSCLVKLLGDIAVSLAMIADSMECDEDDKQ